MTTETTTATQFTAEELSDLRFFTLMAWTDKEYKGSELGKSAEALYKKIVSMQN